jgi:polyhydroxyalkanoate synthase
VRWATEQGLTVFVVSWVNADERQGRKTFSDYMREGFLEAVQAVQDATGAETRGIAGHAH